MSLYNAIVPEPSIRSNRHHIIFDPAPYAAPVKYPRLGEEFVNIRLSEVVEKVSPYGAVETAHGVLNDAETALLVIHNPLEP